MRIMSSRSATNEAITTRTIRARVTHGNLALFEPLDLPDGSEVDVTVAAVLSDEDVAASRTAAGGWKGTAEELIRSTSGAWADLLDCEEFERAVYERRRHHRAPVQL